MLFQERVKKHKSGSSSQPGGERNCHQDMQKKEESKRDGWMRTRENAQTVRGEQIIEKHLKKEKHRY